MTNLRLVGPDGLSPDETQPNDGYAYEPLPHYPWESRPLTIALDPEECATAIHLSNGLTDDAARLLKVTLTRLNRMIQTHPRLSRLVAEHLHVLNDRAIGEVARALDDPEARRREWAASKVLSSRLGRDNPLASAPQSTAQTNINVGAAREIIFSWRTAQSPPVDNAPITIDNQSDDEPDGG